MFEGGWATARITHIAERDAWTSAQDAGAYVAPSLEAEGFIHCSTPWQVVRTANLIFPARHDLVLLVIDPSRLRAEVVFENCEGWFEPFPHVYGEIPVDAVEMEWQLEWDASEKSYRFPEGYHAPGATEQASEHGSN